jgi:hypothetical protein
MLPAQGTYNSQPPGANILEPFLIPRHNLADMKSFFLSSLIGLSALCGCVKYTQPTGKETSLTEDQKRLTAIWQAAREVLREYHFEIDRGDLREGLLVTKPMVTRAPLEFWRDDVQLTDDIVQSAIHKAYCLAVVRISPAGVDGQAYKPHTRVLFARSNQQPPQLTSAAAIAMVYTGGGTMLDYGEDEVERQLEEASDRSFRAPNATTSGVEGEPVDDGGVHPEMSNLSSLGRLTDLEARIDQKIRKRAAELLVEMD